MCWAVFPELKQGVLCAWIYQRILKDNKNQNASYSGSSKWDPDFWMFLSKNQINEFYLENLTLSVVSRLLKN